MEEHLFAGSASRRHPPRKARSLSLEIGRSRFPILSLESDGCTIDAPPASPARGYASIFEGDRLVALCLITFTSPDGQPQRIVFKQRTEARAVPPVDYPL